MAKIGIMNLVDSSNTKTATKPAKAQKSDETKVAKKAPADPEDAKKEDAPSDAQAPSDANSKATEAPSKANSDAPAEDASNTADEKWADWDFDHNDRFVVVDVNSEDGGFFDVPELLPFAYRIFESILENGSDEDRKDATIAISNLVLATLR